MRTEFPSTLQQVHYYDLAALPYSSSKSKQAAHAFAVIGTLSALASLFLLGVGLFSPKVRKAKELVFVLCLLVV